MKKLTPLILVVLVLPLLAFGFHKYYVSVTTVEHSIEDQSLQVISRMFIDDFDNVLEERYGYEADLATKDEKKNSDEYIEKYLRSKLVFQVNGKAVPYIYLGHEYDADMLVCYLEVPDIELEQIKRIGITNELLTDLFEEQQNIVHFKLKGEKHSFILNSENNKGMLKL